MRLISRDYILGLRDELEAKERLRDELIDLAREIAKNSKVIIYRLIKESLDEVYEKVNLNRKLVEELKEKLSNALEYSNSVAFAFQEFVEGEILFRYLIDHVIPTHQDLDVPIEPYLMGLADFCGELVRKANERMIKGDLSFAEETKEVIEEVYYSLLEINPRAYELRKKIDYIASLINRLNDSIFRLKLAKEAHPGGIEDV